MAVRLLWAALLAASALVVLLSYQNQQARAALSASYEARSRPQVGAWVPTVPARTLSGAPIVLAAPGRTQVLYFFTPQCPYCRESAPAIQSFHRDLVARHGNSVDFIGVGGDPTPELMNEIRTRGFVFPIVRTTPRLISLFNARTVPLVLLVGPDGKVLYSRIGVFKNMDDARTLMTAIASMEAEVKVD